MKTETTEREGAFLQTTMPGTGLVNGHPAEADGTVVPSAMVKSAPPPPEGVGAPDDGAFEAVKDANPRTEQAGPKAIDAKAFERDENDWYTEPRWCVDLLIEAEKPTGRIWDPCCGHGTIGRAFAENNHPIKSTDLIQREYGLGGIDFLNVEPAQRNRVDRIWVNPPFGLAAAFVRHAVKLVDGSACFLLPLKWLASEPRQELFREVGRPQRIYVLANRPSMPPGKFLDGETGRFNCDDPFPKEKNGELKYRWRKGDKPGGGAVDFMWVKFVPGYEGPTFMDWLSRGGQAKPYRRTTRVAAPETALKRGGADV